MRRFLVLTLLAIAATGELSSAQDWEAQPLQIPTRWTGAVDPANTWPEYPRPQLVRSQWQNLNGLWDYAITARDAKVPRQFQGSILVPYPVESALSGAQNALQPNQWLWYRRVIEPEPRSDGGRTLLHFGAVDYEAAVFVNGREIGTHRGGYQHFTFDITDALKLGGNELVVRVYDPTNTGSNPRGKQTLYPEGIWYTASSGIWQTVWLENVPRTYVKSITMTPDVDHSLVHLQVNLEGDARRHTVQAIAKNGSTIIARQIVDGPTKLLIKRPRLWSPDDPFLYGLQIRVLKGTKVVDEVESYFGLRKIEVKRDAAGLARIFLNNQYTYNLGTLDQGFWPDGLYTAPTDAALKFDVKGIKAMGFNTIRKHIKIEPDRWYYHCDKLGVLVWQDMVPPADESPAARAAFEAEVKETLTQLHNHPSITTWVLFNEGWGAYDQERLGHWIKQLDPSRLLNSHSGPFHEPKGYEDREGSAKWIASDMTDIHSYPEPKMPPSETEKARVLGEYGGIGVSIDGHLWNDLIAGWGYVQVTPEQMTKAYSAMVDQLKAFETEGLSGSIYTQPFDVEVEQNGLMTYDRAVIKIPVTKLVQIHGKMIPKAGNYATATQGFSASDADVSVESLRYTEMLSQYRAGKKDLPFLRRLTLMALRQQDQASATAVGNEYVDKVSQPYSKDTWAFINTVTRTSKDRGFELLRTRSDEANKHLGHYMAESRIREVIGREEIEPYTANASRNPDWPAIEKKVIAQYGALGAEKVNGARMAYCLSGQDWKCYGQYYARYFATALARSEYPIKDMSLHVLQHVADAKVLDAAIQVVKYTLETSGRHRLAEIHLYASLLYKAGRKQEAIEWQQKAVELSGGSKELADELDKMKAGQLTWPVS